MSLRNVSRTVFAPMKVKGVFTLKQIEHTVTVTSAMTLGEIYVPVFLLALFGFLRLSNLVPPSISQFEPGTLPEVTFFPRLHMAPLLLNGPKPSKDPKILLLFKSLSSKIPLSALWQPFKK